VSNPDLPYAGSLASAQDIFSITNDLGDGGGTDLSHLAAVAGHGGIAVGVHGTNGTGSGVPVKFGYGSGVLGESADGYGVCGSSNTAHGVQGSSAQGDGVQGESGSPSHSGVAGINTGGGNGVFGTSNGGWAGYFDGNVLVTGDITLPGADYAELFEAAGDAGPGTVMAIGGHGELEPCKAGHDRRVAGIVSGAGPLKPALLLNQGDDAGPRVPIAMAGTVYVKADASYGPIRPGDLLVGSDTPGHAMAADPERAFGAVVGKALGALADGRGLIRALVVLA
jgi:hypothetical protein